MYRLFALALALGLATCARQPAFAFLSNRQSYEAAHVRFSVESCGGPKRCVLGFNPGGVKADFDKAEEAIRAADGMLVVTDGCASSCALMADHLRPDHVCIIEGAVFGFHQWSRWDPETHAWNGWIDPAGLHSTDIADWIASHGYAPVADSFERTLQMPFREARKFFPVCRVS